MQDAILVINSGSSSIKFTLFAIQDTQTFTTLATGAIDSIDRAPHFQAHDQLGALLGEQRWDSQVSYQTLLDVLMQWIHDHLGANKLVAAGHRVVHGGASFKAPVRVTTDVLTTLRALIPLVPLHQPHNLAAIDAMAALHPDLVQVACFDTSFHLTNSRISRLYGLPRSLTDEGVWRYGFHGISYEYIADQLCQHQAPISAGRVVVAHLGNGASMCALVDGKSVASTMGFSALDGLLMGTRCGTLDPGVLLYLLQEKKMSELEIETMLYQHSGLLGVSGISNDMRQLLDRDDANAKEAIDLFIYRIVRELGSLVAAAGGLDALVFTGGIGEHAVAIRAGVCAQSAWLGIALDQSANDAAQQQISTADSKVSVWVIPTNEDLMIARHTAALLK